LSELELIEACREGDQRALRALYDLHVERVFGLAYRMCGDEEGAREFTQDAFVRAFDRLEQFQGDSAFSTWLHSVTVSVCLNGLRKRKRRRDREAPLTAAFGVGRNPAPVTPHLRERLHRAVDALPELYRTVFVLYDVEGFGHEEIAEMLDVAVGTSKARLSRARARLRDSLGDLVEEFA
jgi:RNA polymerase sigma-70 factor (ECF subfamily)